MYFGILNVRFMKIILITLILSLSMTFESNSQEQSDLPYYQIPESPESYTAGTVAARLIDGLGFRYYWATEGLKESDLDYKPSTEARTLGETIDHLYGLSRTIVNAPQNIVNERGDWTGMSFNEKRSETLNNLRKASELMTPSNGEQMESYKIIFKRGAQQFEFPFWNLINGPIADALWHSGQLVLMRRAAGNPINSKVNVFMGKLND